MIMRLTKVLKQQHCAPAKQDESPQDFAALLEFCEQSAFSTLLDMFSTYWFIFALATLC